MNKQNKPGLINLHCHSLLSDGDFLPSELTRRYETAGFKALAITDHVDLSNIDTVISSLIKVCNGLNKCWGIRVIPGVELTHIPIEQFISLTKYARKKGAKIVVGHGESPVEPVIKGTNRAAIEAGVDILAHPGKITESDAQLAAKKGVYLEITTRKGHMDTNAHVANAAKKAGAKLILCSDSHHTDDIPTREIFEKTAKEAGLSKEDMIKAYQNAEELFKKIA